MSETSSNMGSVRFSVLALPCAVLILTLAAFGANIPLKLKSFLKIAHSADASSVANAHGFAPIVTGYPMGAGSMVELRPSLIR